MYTIQSAIPIGRPQLKLFCTKKMAVASRIQFRKATASEHFSFYLLFRTTFGIGRQPIQHGLYNFFTQLLFPLVISTYFSN